MDSQIYVLNPWPIQPSPPLARYETFRRLDGSRYHAKTSAPVHYLCLTLSQQQGWTRGAYIFVNRVCKANSKQTQDLNTVHIIHPSFNINADSRFNTTVSYNARSRVTSLVHRSYFIVYSLYQGINTSLAGGPANPEAIHPRTPNPRLLDPLDLV